MSYNEYAAESFHPGESGDYTCPSCGESIVVPLDFSAGRRQEYVEDCPVCCRPNRLVVEWQPDGAVCVRSEPE